MPRAVASAVATGYAGGAAGGKVRNRSTNQQPRMPRELPAPRRLLISESRLLILAAFIRGKITPVTSHADRTFLRSAYSGFCWIPPVLRRLFEVNSEPHTGARPSVRLCVGLMRDASLEVMARVRYFRGAASGLSGAWRVKRADVSTTPPFPQKPLYLKIVRLAARRLFS